MRHAIVTSFILFVCTALLGAEYLWPGRDSILGALMFGDSIWSGQVWRLFTPCLLHANVFHLLFNMMWLISVGSEIERKIRTVRYLALIVVTGVISNCAEFVVAGPFFLGFSGVICGMVGFIAARRRVAPWERYGLNKAMYSVFLFFIFALAAISVIGSIIEAYLATSFPIGFANASHVAGLLTGLGLGRLHWFKEQPLVGT